MRKAAQALRALWVLGNEYLQEAAPWTAIKTDPERAAVIVRTALNLVGPVRPRLGADHPVRRRSRSRWRSARPGRRRGRARTSPRSWRACPPGGRSRSRRCCSGRSRTPTWRPGRSGSAVAERRGVRGRLDAVVALAGLVCLTGALAGLGGALSERLDLAANFAPSWLARRLGARLRPPVRPVPEGAGPDHGRHGDRHRGRLDDPGVRPSDPDGAGEARTLRIIQFNTWDENIAVPATADWIAAQKPDVVVAEEARGRSDPPWPSGASSSRGVSATHRSSAAPIRS